MRYVILKYKKPTKGDEVRMIGKNMKEENWIVIDVYRKIGEISGFEEWEVELVKQDGSLRHI